MKSPETLTSAETNPEMITEESPDLKAFRVQRFEEAMKESLSHTNAEGDVGEHIRSLLEDLSKPKKEAEGKNTIQDEIGNLDAIHQKSERTSSRTRSFVSSSTDFVPIVGSIKMILEGLRGSQVGTEKKIEGLGRFVHTASGVVFLALDLTGVGAIGSEIGKGGMKLVERALVKKVVEREGGRVLEKEVPKLITRGKTRNSKEDEIAKGV